MEISENGKASIDQFIKWINQCKENNVYNLHYTMFPDDKDEHQPYAVCVLKETYNCGPKYDILLSSRCDTLLGRLFLNVMIMNFVSYDEMIILLDLAHSKGYWGTKKYDGDWPRKVQD